MKKKSQVTLHFLKLVPLTGRKFLKEFIVNIFRNEKVPLDRISVIFCSDDYLLELNNRFLKHDYYTDILGFRMSEAGQPLEAELYISVDRVAGNARQLHISRKAELHRVIFHGVLHFCEFGDKSAAETARIRSREDHYLKKYFA